MRKFLGTAISVEDLEKGLVHMEKATYDLRYAWASGEAIGGFLRGLRQGRILGRKCNRCKRTLVPPRTFCEKCFRPTESWVTLRDTGRLNTYSISYVRADASRLEHPFAVGVIEIDGASPGMGLLHLLGDVDPKTIQVGMKLRAVWKPRHQRIGAITDIKYFKPYQE